MTLPPALTAAHELDQEWVEVRACPICGSPQSRPFESLETDVDRVDYRLCRNCGAVYQSPRMSDERLDTYYVSDYMSLHQRAEGVTEKELRVQAGRARQLVQLINAHVRGVTSHLDIGSSTGKLMQAVTTAYGCQSAGIEPAEVYRAYCAAQGLRVYPELKAMLEAGEQRFDLITMAHVLEHLPDPIGFLVDLRKQWLTPDGTLVVEVPNLFGHFSLERPHLLCFHTAMLRRCLAVGGFESRRVVRHGVPRSRLIPLYLSAIARPGEGPTARRNRSSARGVLLRRSVGMAWRRMATRLLPRWAWLPLPDLR